MPDTARFLLLTFAISYGLAAAFYATGLEYRSLAGTGLAVLYMFIPALSVVLVEKVIRRRPFAKRLGVSFRINRWFFVAWLVAPLVGIGAMATALLLPGVSYSPEMEGMFARFAESLTPEQVEEMRAFMGSAPVHPFWLALGQGLIAGVTINAVAAFGEELGWRGFLVDAFGRMSFFRASALIGVIWGIWHAPLILMGHNYPEHPLVGVPMMTAWCTLFSPIFLYVTLKAKSVIAAAILHGTINGTAGLAIFMIEGGNDLTVGATGVAGFLSLAALLLALYGYDRWISGEGLMRGTVGEGMAAQHVAV